MRQVQKVLYYLGLTFLALGLASIVFALLFSSIGNETLSDMFGIIASICGPITFIIFIIRLLLLMRNNSNFVVKTNMPKQKPIKTVDVKEIPKTKEELLYEKYENLYKQNLITKEDLDLKRKELLGK